MSEKTLAGSVRQAGRKGPCRRLRADGKLPGVVYGRGENVCVTVNSRDILKILERKGGLNKVLTTKFEGDKGDRHVMIKDLEIHPLSDTLIHIDFLEIDVDKPVRVAVGLEFSGVPKGVKEKGGKMNVQKTKLNVECLPVNIPAVLEVPLQDLDTGEDLRAKDVKMDSSVTLLDDPESVIVSVLEPKAAEETAEGEEEGSEAAAP